MLDRELLAYGKTRHRPEVGNLRMVMSRGI